MSSKHHLNDRRTAAEIPRSDSADMLSRAALPLTLRQVQVLRSIEYAISVFGYPPSLAELCTMVVAASKAVVVEHLKALERKGFIRRDAGVRRGLQVLVSSEDAVLLEPRPLQKAHLCSRCKREVA